MDITQIAPGFSVRPQILPHEMADIAAAGFTGIVNNRPDQEAPDQPSSEALEAEAKRHGLSYWHIPIVPGQMTEADARALADALRQVDGPVLGFCRTGKRAANLWKLAQQGS